jgi:thiamine-phosphate pyrophosphorylase
LNPLNPLPRLYAILDADALRLRALDPFGVLDAWLDAGVRLVQHRAKSAPSGLLLELAERAARRIHAGGGVLIVNDRADIALLAGADGVHVGQDDLAPRDIRRMDGGRLRIGLSTHTPQQFEAGSAEPVAYLAVGPVFPTLTKGGAPDPPVGLAGVRAASRRSNGLPVVAIGGITLENAGSVIEAGAASVAVISDLLAGDPRARARAFLTAVETPAI